MARQRIQKNSKVLFKKNTWEKRPSKEIQIVSDDKSTGAPPAVTYSQTGVGTDLRMLTSALASVNPALAEYQKAVTDDYNVEEGAKGLSDAKAGKDYANEKKSRAYEKAYYTVKAEADAILARDALQKYATENTHLDQNEFTAGKQQVLAPFIQKSENPYYNAVFVEKALRYENEVDQHYTMAQIKETNRQFKENMNTAFRGMLDQSKVIQDRDMRGKYLRDRVDDLLVQGKAMGMNAGEVTEHLSDVTALYMRQADDDDAFDWTTVKGKDGIAVAETLVGSKVQKHLIETQEYKHRQTMWAKQEEDTKRQEAVIGFNMKLINEFRNADPAGKEALLQEFEAMKNSPEYTLHPDDVALLETTINKMNSPFKTVQSNDGVVKKLIDLDMKGKLTAQTIQYYANELSEQDYRMFAGKIGSGGGTDAVKNSHTNVKTLITQTANSYAHPEDISLKYDDDKMKKREAYQILMWDWLKQYDGREIPFAEYLKQNEKVKAEIDKTFETQVPSDVKSPSGSKKKPKTKEDRKAKLKSLSSKKEGTEVPNDAVNMP